MVTEKGVNKEVKEAVSLYLTDRATVETGFRLAVCFIILILIGEQSRKYSV